MKHLIIISSFIALSASAQEYNSFEQDSMAFRTYLSDNIGTAMNVEILQKTYHYLSNVEKQKTGKVSSTLPEVDATYCTAAFPNGQFHYEGPSDGLASVVVYGGVNVGDWRLGSGNNWKMDNAKFPDSLRLNLYYDAKFYLESIDRKKEKARLVENLRMFDAVSTNKPMFFATIYSKYKGDIEKYVDDLYSKSIMGSKWRMTRFCRWPSAEKLQKDLSVQFAIGLALYDLWIKQMKEETAAIGE